MLALPFVLYDLQMLAFPFILYDCIIQLIHSYEVNISICQPENSDVHRGKVQVNITIEGWLILMLTEKNAPIVLLYDTVSLFLVLFIHKFTQVRSS